MFVNTYKSLEINCG